MNIGRSAVTHANAAAAQAQLEASVREIAGALTAERVLATHQKRMEQVTEPGVLEACS